MFGACVVGDVIRKLTAHASIPRPIAGAGCWQEYGAAAPAQARGRLSTAGALVHTNAVSRREPMAR